LPGQVCFVDGIYPPDNPYGNPTKYPDNCTIRAIGRNGAECKLIPQCWAKEWLKKAGYRDDEVNPTEMNQGDLNDRPDWPNPSQTGEHAPGL
jgi:hypothetical protein